jgi:hypothetical protein
MMTLTTKILAVSLAATLWCSAAQAANTLTPTERGAVAETDRYRAEFRDGTLISFLNKLTGEEYLDTAVKMEAVLPHLPSGLGTQNAPEELAAARKLYDAPWGEQAVTNVWPNQHYADGTSGLKVEGGGVKVELTYTGLTDGKQRFDDETLTLALEIDQATGDLLVTPGTTAPRGGVYGAGFALASLAPAVTVEAPIFEGVRLDRHMLPMLNVNFWGSFWDYSFVALNGEKAGAVGLWCQDKETRLHKTLFYLVANERLTLAVQALNIPPFKDLKSCQTMTWRLQAFDQGWWQAAARFRDWRQKNIKFAPRPDWGKQVAGMITGTQGAGGVHIIPYIESLFPGMPASRVVAWLPDVRGAGFDKNHADNTPYPKFKEDLQLYKQAGMKTITYLQPCIMWGADAKTDREKAGLQFSKEAYTTSPFQTNDVVVHRYFDQNHLGHAGWQRWMLDWVKEYIQDYGTDGIYHDQSYFAPIDNRGLVNGMTSPQGYADYFDKAQAENPNSIHATEHLTEINISGASIGLGCGIHWGTPGYNVNNRIGPQGSMCWQRIKQASPINNALHYPNGCLVGFPHMSSFGHGRARFHHGMDQVERRGDFPGYNVWEHGGLYDFYAKPGEKWRVPFELWANDLRLDYLRNWLFVKHALRATVPVNWEKGVLTYFKGAAGEDFRYEELPWGTAFVQVQDGKRSVHYARIQAVTRAPGAGTILGWPCYDADGPAGLDPSIVYVVEGGVARPAAWFTLPADAAATVRDGYANETLAWLELLPSKDAKAKEIELLLAAPRQPVAVWVDGQRVTPKAKDKQWQIPARTDSVVVALLAEPPAGFDALANNQPLTRIVAEEIRRDLFKPAAFSKDISQKDGKLTIGKKRAEGFYNHHAWLPQYQTLIPVKAPADGVLHIGPAQLGKPFDQKVPAFLAVRVNGKEIKPGENGIDLPMKAGEVAVLSVAASADVSCTVGWK